MTHKTVGALSPSTAPSAVAARMGETYAAQADRMVASFAAREFVLAELRAIERKLRAEAEVAMALRELGL